MSATAAFALRRAFLRFAASDPYDPLLQQAMQHRLVALYSVFGVLSLGAATIFWWMGAKPDEPVISVLKALQLGLATLVILLALSIRLRWVRCICRLAERSVYRRFARDWQDRRRV